MEASEVERLLVLRTRFEERERTRMKEHPDPKDDPLGALAAYAGAKNGRGAVVGPWWDEQYRILINEARAARMSWREITIALGEGDGNDPSVVQRVADKQRSRNQAHARWMEEQEDHSPDDYLPATKDPLAATKGS